MQSWVDKCVCTLCLLMQLIWVEPVLTQEQKAVKMSMSHVTCLVAKRSKSHKKCVITAF